MTFRVLICDDEPEVAKDQLAEIADAVPDGRYTLDPVPGNEEIKDAIQVLLRRRAALRDGRPYAKEDCLFDKADVLVIDYDLLHVDDQNTRYTGEGVARLARVFSECGVIVVLNQYIEAQFDLGLRGHIESFADLNVDGELVGREGLWRAGPWTDFRPWHWPVLAEAAADFRKRAEFLSAPDMLQKPILETLGMSASDAGRLSDTAFGFLAPGAGNFDDLAHTTFSDFIRNNSVAVDTRDGSALVERDPQGCARIAASRIGKWLDREVLGPQDVLVDVPHLLLRCPFLLKGDITNLEAWNVAVLAGREACNDLVPDDAWFAPSHWSTRPLLWWARVEASSSVREARANFDYSVLPDFVFLEDGSRFGKLEEATEFRAGFHNAYDRRFVANVRGIRYAPQRRLTFGG
ncbi:hypothetical protein [Azospirillum doebereinerae]